MATNSMVPYSNPAGNNQTTPGAGVATQQLALPGASATPAASTANPLIPATATAAVPAGASTTSVAPKVTNTSTEGELEGIFGRGVAGMIDSYMNSIGGTDSTILQEYVNSLGPQMATAQAQTNAALGA